MKRIYKPFTDVKYMKTCFIMAYEHLICKIEEMPLSAKTAKER